MGGGAWPFLVGGAICLVNSVNERDLGLLNSYAEPFYSKPGGGEFGPAWRVQGGQPSGHAGWGPSPSGGRVDGHAS